MKQEIYNKIIQKKEFSKLPRKDVELAFSHFEKRQVSDEEKIRLTRDLLRKVFSGFTSEKLLSLKNKSPEWILRKHLSTRERLPYYKEIYGRIFKGFEKEVSVIDLGAGVNGFSYEFMTNINKKIFYLAVEAVGQLVELMNYYFKTRGLENAMAVQESIFNLKKTDLFLKQVSRKKIIFLFKVIDSLEMLERNYSKKLLKEIAPLADRVVVSFATRSMIKKKRFFANRNWIVDFLKKEFEILDDFEIGGERYIVLKRPDEG
ncbi:MAG: hypothetical protein ABIH49_02390 [archaeon]